ncbi:MULTISPECIES: type II toxin-antitoxin system RelB/DinJ family antitoxin [Enterobacteriaceae]|uniref:type II toxin-antitoxin system RelB/DinJ family antitoxin n=1 Tax=Enterobacteriaceae TaxID=543 RepID=UPI000CFF0267|nr:MULTISPECIES: type II toxin-antitoxin system RelB/DinJ family antitoxin [Enterobacteriaceae]SVO57146.1 Antitoxin DinJ [Klebsiella pneumoniae]
MNADALVKARIPQDTKERAVAALNKIGLSTSDVIRLVMMRVADEGRLPFEVKTPNVTTRNAIEELETGRGKRFESAEAMFNDLEI